MGIIKDIKKKIAKGHHIKSIGYSFDGATTDYLIEFSNGGQLLKSFNRGNSTKKLDDFLYLTKAELERKAAKESKHVDGCACCLCKEPVPSCETIEE